jgi:hypothetical protein
MTSASSARAMAGESALEPAGAAADDACDAMLIIPLSRVTIAEAAQLPPRSYIVLVDRAIC